MPLVKLNIKPGVNRENTRYTNIGRWWSMDRVRFRSGTAEAIGGWIKYSLSSFVGICRSLWAWDTNAGDPLIAFGTNLKMYIARLGTLYNITPNRSTTAALANIFTTNATTTVTVHIAAHGALLNDFVTFSGVVDFDGIAFNQEYQITSIVDADHFTITTVLATGSHTAGGAACVATFQVNTGPIFDTYGAGWGLGGWGVGAWGVSVLSTVLTQRMIQWTHANFGQDLAFAQRGGTLYYWQPTTGGSLANALSRNPLYVATSLNAVATAAGFATNNPLFASCMVVTDNQFLIIGGTNPVGSSAFDAMTVRWCDEGNSFQWNPLITNQAGDMRLSSGSIIYAMKKLRQEVIIWTDSAVISMQYVGAPVVFSFTTMSPSSSLISPAAVVVADNVAYWMAEEKFYMYNGNVQTLPCEVRKYVFGNMNMGQTSQVHAGVNEEFNEITWYYVSATSANLLIDSYVTFNYVENLWTFGTMTRTAWVSSPLQPYPIAAGVDGYLYFHENGLDDGSATPVTSLNSYIESAVSEISDGNDFAFVSRILPDVDFSGSTATAPTVTLTLYAADTPGDSVSETNARTIQSTSAPYTAFTPMCYVRLRGRRLIYRLDCNLVGTSWQMGTPRIEIRPDGSR